MLDKHTGVTAMVIVRRYLTQLCMPKPKRQKTRYHPVLVYCWRSVADDGSILNRHWIKTSRVRCRIVDQPTMKIIFLTAWRGNRGHPC